MGVILLRRQRQADGHGGSLPRFTVNTDAAVVLFHHLLDDGQAQPGAFSPFFGGEEGFKDILHQGGIDPGAGIGNMNADPGPVLFGGDGKGPPSFSMA